MSLLTSLISAWKLDEASGNAADSHGSNTLTDNGGVGSGTGKIGTARDLERSSTQYFSRADNASLSTGDIDFTFAMWVNIESTPPSTYNLINKEADFNQEYVIDYTSGSKFRFFINGAAGGLIIASTSTYSTSTWHFVVAWHDAGANTLNIQVNDGAVDSVGTGGAVPLNGTAEFRMGASAFPGFPGYFDGLIDGANFWKRVLTSAERATIYNNGNGLAYPFYAKQQLINGGLLRSPLVNGGLVA